jgi:hypothetical protein
MLVEPTTWWRSKATECNAMRLSTVRCNSILGSTGSAVGAASGVGLPALQAARDRPSRRATAAIAYLHAEDMR